MQDYAYAYLDQADEKISSIIGSIPGRWGRMTVLSRAVIVEVGRLFQEERLIKVGERCEDLQLFAGLIGGTRRGSYHTDVAFGKTMEDGIGLASPAHFGYTLPNIPLAEAASHYGLTGPVYALFEKNDPLGAAIDEAERLLAAMPDVDVMLACEFDHYEDENKGEQLLVNLRIIRRNE